MAISQEKFIDIYELKRKGELDKQRLDERIKEAIRKNIRKYLTEEAIITAHSGKIIKIPIKELDLPKFKFAESGKGLGSARGNYKVGDVIETGAPQPGSGKIGAGEGTVEHIYEAEVTIDELIEVAVDELGLPDIDEKRGKSLYSIKHEFDDIRKSGPITRLDIKRTLITNLKRNAREHNQPIIKNIIHDDLRFRTYVDRIEYKNTAVIIAMMDVSGSMDEHKKYLVRVSLWWIKKYLERLYDGLEFRFIIHDTEATEVDEEKFFSATTGGGTHISSALAYAVKLIEEKYNPKLWNIYLFHFSDGENYESDNESALRLVNQLLQNVKMFYYGQVANRTTNDFLEVLEKGVSLKEKIRCVLIREGGDIANAIREFLKKS